MKTYIGILAATAFAATAFAQMNPLPPSSTTDGVFVQPIGPNAGTDHWEDTSSIGAYKPASTTDGTAPIVSPTYNPLGIPFSASMPAIVQTNLATMNLNGGILRTIFLAESAGWTDSFGYTYDGNPASSESYTVFAGMDSNPSSPGTNVFFGDYFEVALAAGATETFDLWFQGTGQPGVSAPTSPPTTAGGVYTLFNPENSSPYVPPGNVLWAQQSVLANTWIESLGAYADVETYLIALEDWRLDRGSDVDYTDGIFAFQFYSLDGTPFTPVPEPSTYGLLGAGALAGLIWLRRLKQRKPPVVGIQILPC